MWFVVLFSFCFSSKSPLSLGLVYCIDCSTITTALLFQLDRIPQQNVSTIIYSYHSLLFHHCPSSLISVITFNLTLCHISV
mgnify:CR=1 FL=1